MDRPLQWKGAGLHCRRRESVAMDRPLQWQMDCNTYQWDALHCNERELGCVAMGDECVARGDQLALQWWQTRMLQRDRVAFCCIAMGEGALHVGAIPVLHREMLVSSSPVVV